MIVATSSQIRLLILKSMADWCNTSDDLTSGSLMFSYVRDPVIVLNRRWFTVSKLQDPKTTEGIATSLINFWSAAPARKDHAGELHTHPRSPLQQLLLANYCESDRGWCIANPTLTAFRAHEGFVLSQGLQPQFQSYLFDNAVTLTIFVLFQRISFCASTSVSIYTSEWWMHWKGRGADQNQVPRQCFFLLHCVFVVRQSSNNIMI